MSTSPNAHRYPELTRSFEQVMELKGNVLNGLKDRLESILDFSQTISDLKIISEKSLQVSTADGTGILSVEMNADDTAVVVTKFGPTGDIDSFVATHNIPDLTLGHAAHGILASMAVTHPPFQVDVDAYKTLEAQSTQAQLAAMGPRMWS